MAVLIDRNLRFILYVIFNFGLVGSWIVALSGVSALQEKCHNEDFGGCRYRLGLPWWVVWFEFVAIILIGFIQFIPALCNLSYVSCCFLSILATLQMYLADQGLDLKDTTPYTKRANTATAGWILLAIFNLLLIILMGSHPQVDDDDHDYNMGGGKHGPPPPTPGAHPMRPMTSRSQSNLGASKPDTSY